MFRPALVAAAAVLMVAVAAACTAAGALTTATIPVAPTVAPSAAASAAPSLAPPVVEPSVAASLPSSVPASGSASGVPSTTAIQWGVIWDALPASFPRYPGSRPTVTGGGPASAILDIPAEASAASAWFQVALKAAGFTIVGANGPREDGSYDIVATRGSADCQTEISLAPLGTSTTATINLAAACPFS
jgi:hypothetical protein